MLPEERRAERAVRLMVMCKMQERTPGHPSVRFLNSMSRGAMMYVFTVVKEETDRENALSFGHLHYS